MNIPAWQQDIIEEGELYCVGGSLRDALMGIPESDHPDLDFLVRHIVADRLKEILARHGRVEMVGKSFGVFKFRPTEAAATSDIALPRTEVSTGPGHRDFDVRWDSELSLEDDLARRDFTINAIARNIGDGSIIDPFNGRRDAKDRLLKMIFPAAFREDPLRILRGVRFASRFKLTVDPATHDAMHASAGLLAELSPERVQEELTKLLTQSTTPSVGLALLQKLGALAVILPELSRADGVTQNEFHPDDVFWHSLKSCDQVRGANLLVRWAALLHDIGKVDRKQTIKDANGVSRVVFYGHEKKSAVMTRSILSRFRYANEFVDDCTHLVAEHMFFYQPEWNASTVRRFIRRIGEQHLDNLFELRKADLLSRGVTTELNEIDELQRRIAQEIVAENATTIKDLAIDGADVMRVLGTTPGKRVGSVLNDLLDKVLDDPTLNERETLLSILKKDFGG